MVPVTGGSGTTTVGARSPIALADLHDSLADPVLDSMTFLNEIAGRFPDAVSFAAGRPYEEFFEVEAVHRYLRRYCDHLRDEHGLSEGQVNRTLLQYGRTKGIVHHLVATNLSVDEGIDVDPEAIVVTVGAQEAMFLVLRALRSDPRDVLLAVSPNYVGIRGAASLVDMTTLPVRDGSRGIDLVDLARVVRSARAAGQRPRALYLVPDFANPAGASLDRDTRLALLRAASEHDLLILEDNPYGLFHAGGDRPATLKAMDDEGRVVYLGSFAKTGMPGARVGYVVADQPVAGPAGIGLLADELSKIKSMVTVNTSPLAQAVIAGKLLEHGCSLVRANEREAGAYRRNLRHVLDGLAARFPKTGPEGDRVSWNTPAGGFFLVVTVPFVVDDALLERSARDFGVLWTPMHHFYADEGGRHQLRLSVSLLQPPQIEQGLDRLAALIREMRPV
ncbi:GntR family transcriptional regulator [Micromonospora ureilytica]|uniref:GntR family transcriptional regulator n=1 Tax=Micromonospora ureilytica TaxID=709868 RepID=A0A3N9XV85_9ACTN|nr:PLP-dependent aminotransferase family protein [Micromonospora ureilytica]RQX11423.1 GntR family transcriptional regulator [Micromonospora ureilytica]